MKFSEQILKKAVISVHDELAWKKEDVFQVIDELIEDIAVLGGDVWVVMKDDTSTPILTRIDKTRVAVGIIKGKDGKDNIFSWAFEKGPNESWSEFVQRSKKASVDSINTMEVEKTVSVEFADSIYYNLVFVNQFEYRELKEK